MDMKHISPWYSGDCKILLPFHAQFAVEVTIFSKEKTHTCEESIDWIDWKNKFKVQKIKDFLNDQETSFSFYTGNPAKKSLSQSTQLPRNLEASQSLPF